MQHKNLICIVGESGSGKTELSKHLMWKYNWPYISSYTTRPMRPGEVDGVEHTFVTPEDKPDESEMIAYTKFGDYEYWATKSQITGNPTTYVIDEKGLDWLKKRFSGIFNIYSIYIRRDDKSGIDSDRQKRDAGREVKDETSYDLVINNNYGSCESFTEAAGEMIYDMWMDWRYTKLTSII